MTEIYSSRGFQFYYLDANFLVLLKGKYLMNPIYLYKVLNFLSSTSSTYTGFSIDVVLPTARS